MIAAEQLDIGSEALGRRGPTMVRVAVGVALVIAMIGLLTPALATHDPREIVPSDRFSPPSSAHWFGTDDLGRDVYSRTLYGARTSLFIAAIVVMVSLTLGAAIGLAASTFRVTGHILVNLGDGFRVIPRLLIAVLVVTALGPGHLSVAIALALMSIPMTAHLVAALARQTAASPFVGSARALGLPERMVVLRHVAPHACIPLASHAAFVAAAAVVAEASLAFILPSVDPGDPTWGAMLHDGHRVIERAWWCVVAPGAALIATTFVCFLAGERLRAHAEDQP
jgi:peptide/nickel transport system permease protein